MALTSLTIHSYNIIRRQLFRTTLNSKNHNHRIVSNFKCNLYSTEQNKGPSEGEKKLISILRTRFPKAKTIEVNDISGGCGSMYEIYVETPEFNDVRMVKQHQMINEILRKEITQNMHGLRIFTSGVPDKINK